MNYLDIKLKGIDKGGDEKEYKISDFKGKDVVLYFYPKDGTPGCTQEANDFKDNLKKLSSKAAVVGVSPDDITSHKKFMEKYDLNFTLLSDPDHKMAKAFDAWGEKTSYGKKYMGIDRSTFILDKKGEIKKSWHNVNPKGHVDEVLKELTHLK